MRAQRLELPTEGVNLLAEIRMEAIQAALKQHQPEVVVIDSIKPCIPTKSLPPPAPYHRCANVPPN